MELQEWLEILRKERELLINKTKSGTYMAMTIIIPILIYIYFILSNREANIFQDWGSLTLDIVAILLLVIIVAGPFIFFIRFILINYRKYQKIEEITNLILSGEINTEKDLFTTHKKIKITGILPFF